MKEGRKARECRLKQYARDVQTESLMGAFTNGRATTKSLAVIWRTDGRGVRTIVNELRKAGYPICSDMVGYWYAESPDEMLDTVRRIRSHALEELKAVSKMAKVLRERGYEV